MTRSATPSSTTSCSLPAAAASGPLFQFSPEWLDSESGQDRQVLARRWLTAAGRLRLGALVTLSQVQHSDLVAERAPVLARAALVIVDMQYATGHRTGALGRQVYRMHQA